MKDWEFTKQIRKAKAVNKIEAVLDNIRGFKILDLGFVANKSLVWTVLAASNNVPRNLRGTYVGANVEASALVGVGGNAMVGGMRDSFALQPVSFQAQTGINAALAIQVLRIR